MSQIELNYPEGFDPILVRDELQRAGSPAELLHVSNVDLVPTTPGAALECGDGRFDLIKRKAFGPRPFGGINSIAALKTGGDLIGFFKAAIFIKEIGYNPGTHGAVKEGPGCGLHNLWVTDQLSSAIDDFRIPLDLVGNYGLNATQWIKAEMELLGGKHFTLPETHVEQATRWNPFLHTTDHGTNGDRFRVDDWVHALADIPLSRRMLFNLETVLKLKSDAAKFEILYK